MTSVQNGRRCCTLRIPINTTFSSRNSTKITANSLGNASTITSLHRHKKLRQSSSAPPCSLIAYLQSPNGARNHDINISAVILEMTEKSQKLSPGLGGHMFWQVRSWDRDPLVRIRSVQCRPGYGILMKILWGRV